MMHRQAERAMLDEVPRSDRVRTLLMSAGDIEEKRMFGADGFMLNGHLAIAVNDRVEHCLMVRVGREVVSARLDHPGVHPATMGTRVMKDYLFLTAEAVDPEECLEAWVNDVVTFVKALPSKA